MTHATANYLDVAQALSQYVASYDSNSLPEPANEVEAKVYSYIANARKMSQR
jgi:hypothetical protein